MSTGAKTKPTGSQKTKRVQSSTKTKNVERGTSNLGKRTQITVESKISQLVDQRTNSYYTFMASETRDIDANADIDAVYADMWETVNGQVDKEMAEVHKLYKRPRKVRKKD